MKMVERFFFILLLSRQFGMHVHRRMQYFSVRSKNAMVITFDESRKDNVDSTYLLLPNESHKSQDKTFLYRQFSLLNPQKKTIVTASTMLTSTEQSKYLFSYFSVFICTDIKDSHRNSLTAFLNHSNSFSTCQDASASRKPV